jgi:hypothetical protein
VAPDRRWAVLALAAVLAACGGPKKDDADKVAEAHLAQLRARTDSIRKARALDSLATIAYAACSDSVKMTMQKTPVGKKKLAKLTAGQVAPEVTSACGAPKATTAAALAAAGDSAAHSAAALPAPAPAASPTGASAAQRQLASADSARRAVADGQMSPMPAGTGAVTLASSTRPDSSAQGGGTEVEVLRETFAYGGGARDPFSSLINTKSAGPELIDLQLVGIYQDMRTSSNSVAVLREKQTGKRHKLRTGDQIGRLRVAQIRSKDVVFTVEDFGFERQETLSLRKQEDVTQ